MKAMIFISTLLFAAHGFSAENNDALLLKQFHELGITHCDEFIKNNTRSKGEWQFFLNKHAEGIDGPSTEVSMVQISRSNGISIKTDYSFIQSLKQCFLHKRGLITTVESCAKAVDSEIWTIQYELPQNDYRRYQDAKGIILYTKDLASGGCLLEYEFRTKGKHSLYKAIE